MISHKYKCIFIHIPYTQSSFIEKVIDEPVAPKERFLTSLQAKQLYSEYWDDYYKFTVIRNPYDRVNAALQDPNSGITIDKDYMHLNFCEYYSRYGFPKIIEHDHNFYTREDVLPAEDKIVDHSVYQNILSEPLDRVYRIEETPKQIKSDLHKKLNFEEMKATRLPSEKFFEFNNREEVSILYEMDFAHYDYKRKKGNMNGQIFFNS